LDPLVLQDSPEALDHKDRLEPQALKALLDHKAHKDHRATQVPQEQVVYRAKLALQVQVDLPEVPDHKDPMEPLVLKALLDHKAHKDHRATQVPPALRAYRVKLDPLVLQA
jgi:hypothetical protein